MNTKRNERYFIAVNNTEKEKVVDLLKENEIDYDLYPDASKALAEELAGEYVYQFHELLKDDKSETQLQDIMEEVSLILYDNINECVENDNLVTDCLEAYNK